MKLLALLPLLAAGAASAQSIATSDVRMLVEEKICVVEVRMKRSDFTLDPEDAIGKFVKNQLSAERRTMLAGESSCRGWRPGQELSGKFDWLNLGLNGEITRYKVNVEKLNLVSYFYVVPKSGPSREISPEEHQSLMSKLESERAPMLNAHFSGQSRVQVLDRPVAELRAASRRPLRRHFVAVEVQNATLTLDLTKHARNLLNTHRLEFEVPRETYERADKVWDAKLSLGAFVFSGRLSAMRGKIVRKWTVDDPSYEEIRTTDGQDLVARRGLIP